MKLWKEDRLLNIFKSMERMFDIYCQSKDMEDFLNPQGKLEAPTLNQSGLEPIFCIMQKKCGIKLFSFLTE